MDIMRSMATETQTWPKPRKQIVYGCILSMIMAQTRDLRTERRIRPDRREEYECDKNQGSQVSRSD